ncbi:mitochondrial carrier domain-containing protein [Sporodiniella umbellata]|nr:mitochondrial carrier domain-containing protein [Sporodiniella umbellata]
MKPPHPYYDEKLSEKEARIKSLFDTLDYTRKGYINADDILHTLNENARYDLLKKCDKEGTIDFEAFKSYIIDKEKNLWKLYSEVNRSSDFKLGPKDLSSALEAAGIHVTNDDIINFIQFIDTEGNGYIDFEDWRNFLLLSPRETTLTEVYHYFQTSTQLTHDAEVIIPHTDEAASNAYKYLAAGGLAGAVSRTCTAPFDRLKIYLITQSTQSSKSTLLHGIKNIYNQGGLRGFFVGNGLNVIKVVPESAIKFYVFETAKSVLAELTQSQDKNDMPVVARFIAGGVAGLTAQFCIYPLETLKTRIMSSNAAGSPLKREKHVIARTARSLYASQGLRGFWPGLAVSLMGVFPYQALDMGFYETLKVTYLQYTQTQKDEHGNSKTPSVLILWACGMVSGSIGATSVYPLNMIRTRLQAQGTPAHPQRYASAWDVASKTFKADGVKGFYKGLGPTLFKVVPSVSISYAVYEFGKRSLGIS